MLAWIVPVLIMGVLAGQAFAQEDVTIGITAPADITAEATGYLTSVNIGEASTSGSAGGHVEITNSAPDAFPMGETVIYWLATDGDGNRAAAVQRVTIIDTTPPYFVGLPEYEIFTTDSPKKAAVDLVLPPARDLADLDVDVSSSYKAGKKLSVGNSTVTFTATDGFGNSASRNMTIVLVDTSPKIQNLDVKVDSPTGATITWDPMTGHASYRLVVTDVDAEKKIISERLAGTTKKIVGLDPDSEYVVEVSAADDKRTKVEARFSTIPLVVITDDFSSIDGWEFKERHYPSEPGYRVHNSFMLSLDRWDGSRAPSAKIQGDGYYVRVWIEKEFDAEQFGDADVYLSVSYRSQSIHTHSIVNNAYMWILNSDGGIMDEKWFVRGGGFRDSGWGTASFNLGSMSGRDTFKIALGTGDAWAAYSGKTVNFDNLYLGTVPKPTPPPVYRGGSAESLDTNPAHEILDKILAGNTDPYQYEDGIRLDNEYNDLVDELLRASNVTAPPR